MQDGHFINVLLMKLRLSLFKWRTRIFQSIILLRAITDCQDQVYNQGLCDHPGFIRTNYLAECMRVLELWARTKHKSLVLKNISVNWEVFERQSGLHCRHSYHSPPWTNRETCGSHHWESDISVSRHCPDLFFDLERLYLRPDVEFLNTMMIWFNLGHPSKAEHPTRSTLTA